MFLATAGGPVWTSAGWHLRGYPPGPGRGAVVLRTLWVVGALTVPRGPLTSAGGSVGDLRRLEPERWFPARSWRGIQAFSRESPDAKSRGGGPPPPGLWPARSHSLILAWWGATGRCCVYFAAHVRALIWGAISCRAVQPRGFPLGGKSLGVGASLSDYNTPPPQPAQLGGGPLQALVHGPQARQRRRTPQGPPQPEKVGPGRKNLFLPGVFLRLSSKSGSPPESAGKTHVAGLDLHRFRTPLTGGPPHSSRRRKGGRGMLPGRISRTTGRAPRPQWCWGHVPVTTPGGHDGPIPNGDPGHHRHAGGNPHILPDDNGAG